MLVWSLPVSLVREVPVVALITHGYERALLRLTGIATVANMIELGQIEAGLVVSGEDGRALVESTIEALNADTSATPTDPPSPGRRRRRGR